nr:hypothetical protein [Bacteroidota bacterium]
MKGSFSFAFMSYSRTKGESHGIVEVHKARLRPQEKPGGPYADDMLNYVDLITGEAQHFWQPCLMYFNHQKVTLK